MVFDQGKFITCTEFEGALIEYLDCTLPRTIHTSLSRHVMRCPLCHDLLNEVKNSLDLCREINVKSSSITKLEARILSSTAPLSSMSCEEFEEYLTDYLDAFLPAGLFHRWERHLVMCVSCTDLPGAVVRSIGACLSSKGEEIDVPITLQQRIIASTTGTPTALSARAPMRVRISEWTRGLGFPISFPQLAPVAMIALLAFLFFGEMVSSNGSVPAMYATTFELAMQTYDESSGLLRDDISPADENKTQPIEGTFVNGDNRK